MRSIRAQMLLVASLVIGISTGSRSGATQDGLTALSHPELKELHLPSLTHALQTPESLWLFLTDPHTPYSERMAAAVQGKQQFPLSWLSRLMMAQESLEEEQNLHHWGLKPPPMSASPASTNDPLPASKRIRLILGHEWTVPVTGTAFEPTNWEQAKSAPWPWQVRSALDELFDQLTPKMHIYNPPSDVAYAEAWYAEAYKMPCRTDQEATRFVEATLYPLHYKSLHLLARWRQIVLDPRFPHAAQRVASRIADAMRLWADPRAEAIGQAITCDILRESRDPRVYFDAGWYSFSLSERSTEKGDEKLPSPLAVVTALGDAALDSRYGTESERLTCFIAPACALLPDSPIKVDIARLTPGSPEAHQVFISFGAWFQAHRPDLARKGEEQLRGCSAIDVIRKEK